MDVLITRHGARIDNGPDRDPSWLQKAGHGRKDDPHLSPSGELACAELAKRLSTVAPKIEHIITSPFLRCVQTATIIASALGLPIKVEPGICEVLLTYPPGFLSTPELAKQFSNIDISYTPVTTREDLKAEFGDAAAAKRAQRAAQTVRGNLKGTILFVSHGAPCVGLVQAFGHGFEYVGYTTLTHFKPDQTTDGGWRLEGTFGDASHLSDQQTAIGSAW
eukprot:TRINITY_DN67821_c4_g2_i1.p1 TRINITY_DN67821_c4_g2~~TRINITY_DN67821_c4_g2_i1.p1  ORF type:complete len:220 (-),score=14.87 TRINITY_DN67821_c4_g2_i1:316-975(-)